jgi:phage gpG-like protein
MIRLKITPRNIAQVSDDLKALVRRVEDITPVLGQFGVHMIRSIQKNFDVGGRPRWKPWAASTAINEAGGVRLKSGKVSASRRRTARARTGKVLYDTGRLANSVTASVTGRRTLLLGSNVVYAAIHHFGGTIRVPEIVPRRAGALRWYSAGGAPIFAKRARPHTVLIPARPWLVVQDEDLEILTGMVERHVVGP